MCRVSNIAFGSKFFCTKCGHEGIPIVRRKGAEREAGHLKKIFCLTCQREVNHVECKEYSHYSYDDFLLEYENHNFDEAGNRKMPYKAFKQKILKKGEVTG